jgi:hypothetical protein
MVKLYTAYGRGQPEIPVLPPPIGLANPPTSLDTNFSIGQVAFSPQINPTAFFLYAGAGNWVEFASNTGDILAVVGAAPIAASTSLGTATISMTGPANVTTLTAHGVVIGEGTSALSATSAGTANQVLQSGGASSDPTWSTATYPATTTANQLLYSSATNTIGGLTSANNATLTTSTTGVPSLTTLANGQTIIGQGAAASPAATFFSNSRVTYVPKFTNIPTMSSSIGGVAAVTINTYNIWAVPQWGAAFEQYNTTVSTAIAPSMSATAGNGMNINTIGGANAKSIEITEGNTVNSKNAFVIGTSAAFYVQASFNINTLANVADVYLGFRKVQTYQNTIPAGYTDYATIGVHGATGEIELQTQIGSGGNVITDTTNAITAATTFTVRVNVSATGVVTYLLNGIAPTTVAAYTFTTALTVVPYLIYTSAAGGNTEVDLVNYQCGLQ